MVDQTTLEQKRAEARAYKGVTYDNRIDKFTVSIMLQGERHYLGSFNTAGEASVIYEQTRAQHKIERAPRGISGLSMKKALVDFEDAAERDADKLISAGQILTAPDGQRFRLEGMRRREKHKEYVWSSCCKLCPALFEQSTGLKLRNANGMIRTCPVHRGQLNKMPWQEWLDPVEWSIAPKLLAPVSVASARGVEPIPENWRETRKEFARRFREQVPNATLAQIDAAHVAHITATTSLTLTPEERIRYDAMMAASQEPTNARLEDMALLAEDPPASNDDLL